MNKTLDQEYHIYYRRSTKWIALGQFDQAMKDDDECEWQMSDQQTPELHLLIVSSNSEFKFWDLIQYLRVHTMALLLGHIMFLQLLLELLLFTLPSLSHPFLTTTLYLPAKLKSCLLLIWTGV